MIFVPLRVTVKTKFRLLYNQRSEHEIKPTQKHYDVLQVDEFHTFVGHKKNKVWLIYAHHQKTGQIVAFVWGKRDLKTTFE